MSDSLPSAPRSAAYTKKDMKVVLKSTNADANRATKSTMDNASNSVTMDNIETKSKEPVTLAPTTVHPVITLSSAQPVKTATP